jgi:hypothetical protein
MVNETFHVGKTDARRRFFTVRILLPRRARRLTLLSGEASFIAV